MFKKRAQLSYITLALGLSFTSLVHADYYQDQNQNSSYSNQSYGNNDYRNNRGSGISDQDLANKIRDKIGSGWFSKGFDQVRVQVNNGNVTLQGSVKTWDDKEKVEKEVRNMDGVRSLNSQLNVQDPNSKKNQQKQFSQDTATSSSDNQLNNKIRDNVSRGWLWDSYKDVALNTSNGVVTLEGSVDNLSDQQKLMKEVQKVEGVKSVKSNLRINNQ